jgi:hypothetical protein
MWGAEIGVNEEASPSATSVFTKGNTARALTAWTFCALRRARGERRAGGDVIIELLVSITGGLRLRSPVLLNDNTFSSPIKAALVLDTIKKTGCSSPSGAPSSATALHRRDGSDWRRRVRLCKKHSDPSYVFLRSRRRQGHSAWRTPVVQSEGILRARFARTTTA